MPERRRPALRPLPPDLAGPVCGFTERLREIYWQRLTLNQRELAAALHLSKSPISRYLNGQEVIPAAALEQFVELARLTPQERDLLRTLRAQAETALAAGPPHTAGAQTVGAQTAGPPQTAGAPDTAEQAAAPRRPRWRRVTLWVLPVLVLLAGAGVALALVSSAQDGGGAGCERAHRQYTVTADGDVLDENRNDIGDVHQGDTFTLDPPPAANPYQARHYGHVPGRNVTGFVDQAKLRYVGDVCG